MRISIDLYSVTCFLFFTQTLTAQKEISGKVYDRADQVVAD